MDMIAIGVFFFFVVFTLVHGDVIDEIEERRRKTFKHLFKKDLDK